MGLKESKLFNGNQFVQFFGVVFALYIGFLGFFQFFRSALGVTMFGSLVRFFASVILLYEVFFEGVRSGLFSREFSLSDFICVFVGLGVSFVGSFSFLRVVFSEVPLFFSPLVQLFLDLFLVGCLFFQLLTK